jgi:hypothetical protein
MDLIRCLVLVHCDAPSKYVDNALAQPYVARQPGGVIQVEQAEDVVVIIKTTRLIRGCITVHAVEGDAENRQLRRHANRSLSVPT